MKSGLGAESKAKANALVLKEARSHETIQVRVCVTARIVNLGTTQMETQMEVSGHIRVPVASSAGK